MPYGVLDPQRLSQASRTGLDRALDWWQKSMQTSKHKTYFVLTGYDLDQVWRHRRHEAKRLAADPMGEAE